MSVDLGFFPPTCGWTTDAGAEHWVQYRRDDVDHAFTCSCGWSFTVSTGTDLERLAARTDALQGHFRESMDAEAAALHAVVVRPVTGYRVSCSCGWGIRSTSAGRAEHWAQRHPVMAAAGYRRADSRKPPPRMVGNVLSRQG